MVSRLALTLKVTGWIVVLLLARLPAQTPQQVVVTKLGEYRQTSATDRDFPGTTFAVTLTLTGTPAPAGSLQLRSPSGTMAALERDNAGAYSFSQKFATATALDAAFPDGVYTLTIAGPAPTTLNLAILTGDPVDPVLITNYDALQTWPDLTPLIRWPAIKAPTSGSATLSLEITRSDGQPVYATPGSFLADSTQTTAGNLPAFTPLTGNLSYTRMTTAVVNNGATTLRAGRGFKLAFPLQCQPAPTPPPTILFQPASKIAAPADLVQLNVGVSGDAPLTFQWKKDGVPVLGATTAQLEFARVQVANAGTYTVDVTNPGGKVTSAPAIVGVMAIFKFSVHAGIPGKAGSADGAPGIGRLGYPQSMAIERNGTLYVTDNNCIRKITPDGTITTFAGQAGAPGSVDDTGGNARFSTPNAIALDALGNLYVADTTANTVRKVTPNAVVTTLAGAPGQRGFLDGTGTAARFSGLGGLAVDATGNIFVGDGTTIRRITPGGAVTTIAGQPSARGFVDGAAASARFASVEGLAFSRDGLLYVGDGGNYAVRTVSTDGRVGTFLAANPGNNRLSSVAVDDAGNVYVAGGGFGRISPDGSGTSLVSFPIYENPSEVWPYFLPDTVIVRADGTVFLTDRSNATILKGTLIPGSGNAGIAITTNPQPAVVAPGTSVALRVEATGPNLGYQWRKDGNAIAGATSSTLYLTSASQTDAGSYTVVVSNGIGSASTTAVALSVPATSERSRLVNLSIRTRAGNGAETLTIGAVLGADAAPGASAEILVRAVGPGLGAFGVTGVLTDPALAVFRDGRIVATNDNWGTTPALATTFAAVGAFPLAADSLDAALVRSLTGGAYTMQITGNAAATGIVLAEIYDASNLAGVSPPPRLVNVSTLTQVGTGADLLIAGFAIQGATSKTVLIRAVGPSLQRFNVTNVLADPQLQVLSGNRVVATNDNWNNDFLVSNAAERVGAFRLDTSQDAAVVVTLPPGTYSVQVSGVRNTTGVALMEIYEVP